MLGHLCDAWSVRCRDDAVKDGAALTSFGVGGSELLQALYNAGYLPSYNIGRRHIEGALYIHPNEPPTLLWLFKGLSQL